MRAGRRSFVKGVTLGAGGSVLAPMLGRMGLEAAGVPQRFVFVVKSSGIIPGKLDPVGLGEKIGDGTGYVNEHHRNLNEWPYVVVGGSGGRMQIAGRYVRYPSYGNEGHRTIGNWWTTWLNAFGNPVEHYGNLDLGMKKNGMVQTGALTELMV